MFITLNHTESTDLKRQGSRSTNSLAQRLARSFANLIFFYIGTEILQMFLTLNYSQLSTKDKVVANLAHSGVEFSFLYCRFLAFGPR